MRFVEIISKKKFALISIFLFLYVSLNLFVNSLASDVVDLDFQYRHSGLDTNASRETVWKLDLGLRYHFDKFHDAEGMFRPFLGMFRSF